MLSYRLLAFQQVCETVATTWESKLLAVSLFEEKCSFKIVGDLISSERAIKHEKGSYVYIVFR